MDFRDVSREALEVYYRKNLPVVKGGSQKQTQKVRTVHDE
jgi:hypothetical protein